MNMAQASRHRQQVDIYNRLIARVDPLVTEVCTSKKMKAYPRHMDRISAAIYILTAEVSKLASRKPK